MKEIMKRRNETVKGKRGEEMIGVEWNELYGRKEGTEITQRELSILRDYSS